AADPENAGQYKLNAAAGQKELLDLATEIDGILAPLQGRNFIVFHDAYQYFEEAFNFYAAGAISLSDARDPSPARIAEIQNRINEQSISCVLSEPQFNPNIVAAVTNGSEVKMGILDPLGVSLNEGKTLYFQTLRNLAKALSDCL
ncbi:MAG: metal ABC transporter solute-binding protein, Zn/Mn family, partial [Paracoccaceae bacterium]